jgi:hypothetical protein
LKPKGSKRGNASRSQIATVQLDRIHADLPCDRIDRPFEHQVVDLFAVAMYGLAPRLVDDGDRDPASSARSSPTSFAAMGRGMIVSCLARAVQIALACLPNSHQFACRPVRMRSIAHAPSASSVVIK